MYNILKMNCSEICPEKNLFASLHINNKFIEYGEEKAATNLLYYLINY